MNPRGEPVEDKNDDLHSSLMVSNDREITTMVEQKLTMSNYGDHELFGSTFATKKLIEKLKTGNDSECIIFTVGTFASKERFRLKDLTGTDKRLRQMVQGLDIEHAFPIQRYSWPKIHKSAFANLYVSAEGTGKTYSIILYAVSKCIAAASISEAEELLNADTSCHVTSEYSTSPEDLINHPKYIIICSGQDKVEEIHRTINHMKEKTYGDHVPATKRNLLTPVSRTIKLEHDNDKLAQRCIESDILISSPQVLIKCLEQGLINFARCNKIFFDDLDVALQLQNSYIRKLIKIYLIHMQTQLENDTEQSKHNKTCRMHMFSRKWTDLVKQFVASIFPQRIILFSSIAEASVYSNVKFEVEWCETHKKDKIGVLTNLLKQLLVDCSKIKERVAIVCRTDDEAELVCTQLTDKGFRTMLFKETEETNAVMKQRIISIRDLNDMLFVISDSALEFEVEYTARKRPLNDMMHLVHVSLPDDMLTFDQRFRLLYKNIQDGKSGMTSTFIVNATSGFKLSKQIYDLASRSPVTMKSTKYLLRNSISNQGNQICWRWATTGLCRLEKLSRNDRFGSYCLDRHAVERHGKNPVNCDHGGIQWPKSGMVRISITHIISPSEFYFIFEAFKTNDSGKWSKFQLSGTEYMKTFQRDLNALKTVQTRSITLNKIAKGMIYAVYFPQESRVDRVLILDEPKQEGRNLMVNKDLEYCKQISIFKIDHGVCLDVYVKNLIELPEALAKIPSQCHKGYYLGYRPPDNEPNWLYKSKKHFYDILSAKQIQDITAWIRLYREGCFWFEGMLVSRKLANIDSSDIWTVDPHEELRALKLAEHTQSEPPILPASTRLETLCRWNHVKLAEASQYAFIRRDKANSDVFLLNINRNLDVIVRQSTYNKQLIELERQFAEEFRRGKLLGQEYLAHGVICIGKIDCDPSDLCLNRVRILEVKVHKRGDRDIESPKSTQEPSAFVECLDHGDKFWLQKSQLFQATIAHVKKLPFQAIKCELANLNKQLLDENYNHERNRIIDGIYDVTREDNEMKRLKCKSNTNGQVYLYVPNENQSQYEPLYRIIRDNFQLELHDNLDDICQETLKPDEDVNVSDGRSFFVTCTILQLLQDIAKESMLEAKSNQSQA